MNDIFILGRNILDGDITLGDALIMSYNDFFITNVAGSTPQYNDALLLDDGVSFLLLDDGTSKLLIRP